MDKVIIPNWIDRAITHIRQQGHENKGIMRILLNSFHSEKELNDIDRIGIINLAKAIEEGYEVEVEYLTLEQVMSLPSGTLVTHPMLYDDFTVRRDFDNESGDGWLIRISTGKAKQFTKHMLVAKWSVVK